jgi:hypothetical protein
MYGSLFVYKTMEVVQMDAYYLMEDAQGNVDTIKRSFAINTSINPWSLHAGIIARIGAGDVPSEPTDDDDDQTIFYQRYQMDIAAIPDSPPPPPENEYLGNELDWKRNAFIMCMRKGKREKTVSWDTAAFYNVVKKGITGVTWITRKRGETISICTTNIEDEKDTIATVFETKLRGISLENRIASITIEKGSGIFETHFVNWETGAVVATHHNIETAIIPILSEIS